MSIGRKFNDAVVVGTLLLATSAGTFAQTSDSKPPDASGLKAAAQLSPAPAPNPCSSGMNQAQILTDTMGVDFAPYLTGVTRTVRQNWYNLMPSSVYPPINRHGKVSIEFSILKDGKASDMKIRSSSGDVALDRAAWGSIIASTPFAALPAEFHGPLVGMRFFFFYNLEVDTSIAISISPCGDIQVPAGSTLQFSASRKSITDASVKWRVSGPGCSQSSCGTISDTGLYAAPQSIPSPPTVIVEAVPATESFAVARSKLTVVPASSSH
jgi:TonB family protein